MRARGKAKKGISYKLYTNPPRPATQRQIELVYELAEYFNVDPPEVLNRDSCRQFINNHIRQRGKVEHNDD